MSAYYIRWEELAALTVILTFVGTGLLFLLQPRCKLWVWAVVEGDPVKARALVEKLFQNELRSHREVKELVEANRDSLEYVNVALQRQGEEMRQLPRIAASMEQQTRAFDKMVITLGKIHEEVQEHGRRFERWDGFMEGQEGKWLGTTRRKTSRREHDPPPEDV